MLQHERDSTREYLQTTHKVSPIVCLYRQEEGVARVFAPITADPHANEALFAPIAGFFAGSKCSASGLSGNGCRVI
jgi:hypothetical protein